MAERKKEVVTWFNDPHDADLQDVLSLVEAARKADHVKLMKCDLEPYGMAVVAYNGEMTDEEIQESLNDPIKTMQTKLAKMAQTGVIDVEDDDEE